MYMEKKPLNNTEKSASLVEGAGEQARYKAAVVSSNRGVERDGANAGVWRGKDGRWTERARRRPVFWPPPRPVTANRAAAYVRCCRKRLRAPPENILHANLYYRRRPARAIRTVLLCPVRITTVRIGSRVKGEEEEGGLSFSEYFPPKF